MREKLEKTFKEKGFLIQTQQLESAEGATYCKFRQLRKFTRYLFRSWKDYLPDNVKDINSGGVGGGVGGVGIGSVPSPEPTETTATSPQRYGDEEDDEELDLQPQSLRPEHNTEDTL